ncbi:elongator complex protein 4 [Monosporozyma unispora]|nr:hypothetical protein C6P44_000650 [Kazachstania unispora]
MSFRKRGEMLNGGGPGGPGAMRRTLPNRGGVLPNRGAAPGRTSMAPPTADNNNRIPVRGASNSAVSSVGLTTGMNKLNINSDDAMQVDESDNNMELLMELNHPGVRPSTVSANLVASTGCFDLDKLLSHMGLPLGHSLLIEEETTTDFQSILTKLFAVQGVVHNRLNGTGDAHKQGNTHVVFISMNQFMAKELPGVYKGSRKEIKKSKIKEEENKLSVQNLANQESKAQPTRYKDLKIAWKYKYNDESSGKKHGLDDNNDLTLSDDYKDYTSQFDITSRLLPAATPQELSFISPMQPVPTILSQLETIIKKHKDKLIRIVVPSFLHPAMYPPQMFSLPNAVGLLHGLKSIVKKHSNRTVMLMTLSKEPLTLLLQTQIESMFDGIVDLEPFPQEMLQYLEKIYKGQPNKVQHGLVHLIKLPVFSDRGEMHHKHAEYAFKNGKKRFEIEEWSIPVDDGVDDGSDKNKKEDSSNPQRQEAQKQTKQAVDF